MSNNLVLFYQNVTFDPDLEESLEIFVRNGFIPEIESPIYPVYECAEASASTCSEEQTPSNEEYVSFTGRRIVELDVMIEDLNKGCTACKKPLNLACMLKYFLNNRTTEN